jgi:hypothetical protein
MPAGQDSALHQRRCCLYHQGPGSDAAGVVGGFTSRAFGPTERNVQAAAATPEPSRRHPIGARRGGNPQALEVKLYAVLQLPGGKVSGG